MGEGCKGAFKSPFHSGILGSTKDWSNLQKTLECCFTQYLLALSSRPTPSYFWHALCIRACSVGEDLGCQVAHIREQGGRTPSSVKHSVMIRNQALNFYRFRRLILNSLLSSLKEFAELHLDDTIWELSSYTIQILDPNPANTYPMHLTLCI